MASPTIIPGAATTPGIPVTTMTPSQEALAVTTVLGTPEIIMPPTLTTPAVTEIELELSVPDTVLPV